MQYDRNFEGGYLYAVIGSEYFRFFNLGWFYVSILDFTSVRSVIILDINGSTAPNRFERDVFS